MEIEGVVLAPAKTLILGMGRQQVQMHNACRDRMARAALRSITARIRGMARSGSIPYVQLLAECVQLAA